jgi:hypothetical protein
MRWSPSVTFEPGAPRATGYSLFDFMQKAGKSQNLTDRLASILAEGGVDPTSFTKRELTNLIRTRQEQGKATPGYLTAVARGLGRAAGERAQERRGRYGIPGTIL